MQSNEFLHYRGQCPTEGIYFLIFILLSSTRMLKNSISLAYVVLSFIIHIHSPSENFDRVRLNLLEIVEFNIDSPLPFESQLK